MNEMLKEEISHLKRKLQAKLDAFHEREAILKEREARLDEWEKELRGREATLALQETTAVPIPQHPTLQVGAKVRRLGQEGVIRLIRRTTQGHLYRVQWSGGSTKIGDYYGRDLNEVK